ncbi:MAG: hydroxymethylpyrimidine/phosphomethylpyrimidine kinase family protein, partial [Candidatus Methylomirabilales bacterium]
VMVSGSGHRLLSGDGLSTLRDRLLPLALVATPNLSEAAALLGREVCTVGEMRRAARDLRSMGPASVLVTGGHLEGPAIDVFYDGGSFTELASERIDSPHTHGTGCVLSAAIAAYLAGGEPVIEAVRKAKHFVTGAIRHGLQLGGGPGPVNPGWALSPPGPPSPP